MERRVTALEALRLGKGWTAGAVALRVGMWPLAVGLAVVGGVALSRGAGLMGGLAIAFAAAVGWLAWTLTLRRVAVPAVVDLSPGPDEMPGRHSHCSGTTQMPPGSKMSG